MNFIKSFLFVLLLGLSSTAAASELDCYGSDLGETTSAKQCFWEQQLVNSALKQFEPDTESFKMYCGYNNDLAMACRALIRYVEKGTNNVTNEVFEEWFVFPQNNVRWRGFFVKSGATYDLVWSNDSTPLSLKDKDGNITYPEIISSNKGQRNLDVDFSSGYPVWSMAYINVDPTQPIAYSDFVYTDSEVSIEKYNLVEDRKIPVERNPSLRYQAITR